MRWFFRSREITVPAPTIPQCPILAGLEKRIQELDTAVNALKLKLLELYFYIIGPTRAPSSKPPSPSPSPSPTTRRDRYPRALRAAAADADETVTHLIEELNALGPHLTALQAEIEARRAAGCAEDASSGTEEAVEDLCGYVEEVDRRYRRIWERVDGVLAMRLGGWEVGLARTVAKELDPLELRTWR